AREVLDLELELRRAGVHDHPGDDHGRDEEQPEQRRPRAAHCARSLPAMTTTSAPPAACCVGLSICCTTVTPRSCATFSAACCWWGSYMTTVWAYSLRLLPTLPSVNL